MEENYSTLILRTVKGDIPMLKMSQNFREPSLQHIQVILVDIMWTGPKRAESCRKGKQQMMKKWESPWTISFKTTKITWKKESECVIKRQDQKRKYLKLIWQKLLQPTKTTTRQRTHLIKLKWNLKTKKQQILSQKRRFVAILRTTKSTMEGKDPKLIYQLGLMDSNFKVQSMLQQLME